MVWMMTKDNEKQYEALCMRSFAKGKFGENISYLFGYVIQIIGFVLLAFFLGKQFMSFKLQLFRVWCVLSHKWSLKKVEMCWKIQ